jgi:DHA1 family bicyclomycin/chloramphenicol resistance-like MFS transporter
MMRSGVLIALAGTVAMASLALAGVYHPLALFIPGMAIGFANAIAAPSSTIGAISRDPAIAGAASGLLGFLQLVTAAASTQLVAALTGRTPLPLALVLLVLCLVALLALRPISRIDLSRGTAQAEPVGEPAASEPTR